MSYPHEDQETVITMDRASGVATVWTSDTRMMTKLDKLYLVVDEDKVDMEVWAKKYQVPLKYISFRTDPAQRPDYKPKRKGNPQLKNVRSKAVT